MAKENEWYRGVWGWGYDPDWLFSIGRDSVDPELWWGLGYYDPPHVWMCFPTTADTPLAGTLLDVGPFDGTYPPWANLPLTPFDW